MTTIVYRDGKMGADRASLSDGLKRSVTKVFKITPAVTLKNGPKNGDWLIGFVGDGSYSIAIKNWLQTGINRPHHSDYAVELGKQAAMIVDEDFNIWQLDTSLSVTRIEEEYHAMGAGQDIAYGALDAGLSCSNVLEIVCNRSAWCGMGCDYVTFDAKG
jgi:hypothetical protein